MCVRERVRNRKAGRVARMVTEFKFKSKRLS